MTSYILGDNINFGETLEIEFKEFMLKLDCEQYFDTTEIEQIINNVSIDKTRFNSMIFDNIEHYFKYYLPKYLAVFANSKLSHSNIYFGINDFGEFTGIPFFGNFDENFLTILIESIKYFIKLENTSVNINDFLSQIKIELIKLEKDSFYLEDSVDTIVTEFLEKKKKYEKDYFENMIIRKKWKEQMEYYVTSIREYVSNVKYRKEVADFIRQSPDSQNYLDIINLLESTVFIEIVDYNDISNRKLNKNDVIYWVTEFKDTMIEKLRVSRPVRVPYTSFSYNIYSTQLSLLTNLRYRFCSHYKDINYYVIKLSLPTNFNGQVYYKTIESDNWYFRTRAYVNGGPGCV
jgi:hypothetical protein